jgi:hypothetical protein
MTLDRDRSSRCATPPAVKGRRIVQAKLRRPKPSPYKVLPRQRTHWSLRARCASHHHPVARAGWRNFHQQVPLLASCPTPPAVSLARTLLKEARFSFSCLLAARVSAHSRFASGALPASHPTAHRTDRVTDSERSQLCRPTSSQPTKTHLSSRVASVLRLGGHD